MCAFKRSTHWKTRLLVLALTLNAVTATVWGQAPPEAKVVHFQELLKLVEDKTDEAEILKRIKESPTIFTLGAADVALLEKAGATAKVLEAIKTKQKDTVLNPALEIADLAIILDCSGSMAEKVGTETKMDIARPVVIKLLRELPHGMNVTFVVYGHNRAQGCNAVEVVRKFGPWDGAERDKLISYVQAMQPVGGTPITLALRQAGEQLLKGAGPAAVVLITDGKDTCPVHGAPETEAAALAKKLNMKRFDVVGLGINNAEEKAAVKKIADAVTDRGTWYDAQDADAFAQVANNLAKAVVKAKPPEVSTTGRRAIKVIQPAIAFPVLEEIFLCDAGASTIKSKVAKYGQELRLPSTGKYDIYWKPKEGEEVLMLKDFSIPDRKVVEVKPEASLGLIQVVGDGKVDRIFVVATGGSTIIQRVKKFGDVLVVPAGTYDVHVDGNVFEEKLQVEAGKLYKLE